MNPHDDANFREMLNTRANGMPVEVRGMDLSNMDLTHRHLENVTFFQCNLRYTDFSNSTLKDCAFREGTVANGARFVEADCTGTFFGASLHQAILDRANLYRANLQCASLANASLRGAKLVETVLPAPALLLACRWDPYHSDVWVDDPDLPLPEKGDALETWHCDLMLWDAMNHPFGLVAFDSWATDGRCPYAGWARVGRAAFFDESHTIWKKHAKHRPTPNPWSLALRSIAFTCRESDYHEWIEADDGHILLRWRARMAEYPENLVPWEHPDTAELDRFDDAVHRFYD